MLIAAKRDDGIRFWIYNKSPTHILSGTSETEFALFLSIATRNCRRWDISGMPLLTLYSGAVSLA
jgi:hypothetical protein